MMTYFQSQINNASALPGKTHCRIAALPEFNLLLLDFLNLADLHGDP